MRVTVCAVGRLTGRNEFRTLTDDYMARFNQIGRRVGLGPFSEVEVEDKKGGGIMHEGELLRAAVPQGALTVALDERGDELTSIDFAKRLGQWRDNGRSGVAFLIGGADGLARGLRADAEVRLCFGRMVWPHMLVRVMLAEQLYRAAGILAGTPYHRE